VAFSDEEKARIRRSLGFVNVTQASVLAYGAPLNAPLLALVETRMDQFMPSGEGLLREDLAAFEETRRQLVTANARMKALEISGVKTNPAEVAQLKEQLRFWSRAIADQLGVTRQWAAWVAGNIEESGGINARVR